MNVREQLLLNLNQIRRRMNLACERCRRDPASVRLVAVTKYAELEWVQALSELGQLALAESRPQQFQQRVALINGPVHWHFIGHLQRNKVDLVVPHAEWIHSVDSLRLVERLSASAVAHQRTLKVLLEVNVSGEASKGGFTPDEARQHIETLRQLPGVTISGLMTMAPLSENPEDARPVFRATRELRDELVHQCGGRLSLPELSMGMSGDFEVAIEEGATFIRIGSSLFEGLMPKAIA